MSRVIAVSNRTAAGQGHRAGGLAVALWEALRASGGVWIGWSGDVVPGRRKPRWTREEGIEFGLIDLSQSDYEGFYLGFANRAVWPVFHYRVDLARFEAQAYKTYAAVNRRLAAIVAGRAAPGDVVWVHDYHFLLLAGALRDAGVVAPIGFFLHIPFPAPEIFQALPQHRDIARAMAAFDLIGVQSEADRANLVRTFVDHYGGSEVGEDRVEVFGRRPKVQAHPIGIDADAFGRAAQSAEARNAMARVSGILGDRALILGVDRMDYTKGLPERFQAVGAFFDTYPEMRGRVSVTQIAPPSRSKVEEYQALRVELDRLAGRINGDYGDLDWIPMRYLARGYTRDELAGLYRIARVALVTPLRDGMNLVAKEFVAAQDPSDPGVLILSEFAGAAEQLRSAILVNPHDTEQMAAAMHQALTMPPDERINRWRAAHRVVTTAGIAAWRESFLSELRLAGAVAPA